MPATTATLTATLYLAALADPAADPFAAPPAPAADPLDIAVPAPDDAAWAPPPPPPPPAPPPPRQQPVYEPPPPVRAPEPAPLPAPVAAAPDAGKRTTTIGLVFLGVGVAAGVATIYAYREFDRSRDRLAAEEQYNAALAMEGLPTSDTDDLRDDVKNFRGLTIGLGVAAGVLLLVGGGVALAGAAQRRRAARVTLRPGGLALQF